MHAVADQRERESARAEKERTQLLGISLFFWIVQAVIATAGIGLIFWQSYREWGSLPAASGYAGWLYFAVGIVLALVWGGTIYAWSLWCEPM